jgi:hypothetical protein
MITIPVPSLALLASFALRYAYPRRTAAAHAAIAQALPIWDQLPESDRVAMRREVERGLVKGEICRDCIDDWERFLAETAGKD